MIALSIRAIALAVFVIWCSAPVCAREHEQERTHRIEVTSNGWHTGIVIPVRYLDERKIPEMADLGGAVYLKFGWGEESYYPADNPGLRLTARAILWPTGSVMHVVGLGYPATVSFPGAEVLAIALTEDMFDRLVTLIAGSFDRQGAARAPALAPGRYAASHFYKAHGRFHLFNTCNTWTMRVFAAAGLPVSATGVITAGAVMRRLRPVADRPQAATRIY